MNPAKYLADSAGFIVIGLVACALAFMVLTVGGVSWQLAALACGLFVLAGALILAADYARRRRFFRDLDEVASTLTVNNPQDLGTGRSPLWAMEVLDEPEYLEGRITFDTMRSIAKAANDEVARARRRVDEYREFVETWVHEAKSPLAAAHLMTENLRSTASAEGASGAVLDKVSALDEELDRTEGYVEQALFYARSETLDRDYLIRSYCVSDLVVAAVKSNARALIAAHVTPVMADLDRRVFTDEKWMGFILGQVIQNSIKYASTADARITFTCELADEGAAEERVLLRVEDNGCGVPAEDLPRVFDKGFTGAAGRTGKRSTGIGLYLVKRLCTKMGVEVTADSIAGHHFATTFAFPTNKFHYFEG